MLFSNTIGKCSKCIITRFTTRLEIINRAKYFRLNNGNNLFTYSYANSKFIKEKSEPCDLIDINKVLSEGFFKPIFYFPYIVHTRVICRLKLYQTGITFALLPIYGIFSSDALIYLLGVSTFATFMLFVMGEFFCKFIGALYLSDDSETLIISRLSFFGNRKNFSVSVSDIIPLSDTSEIPTDIYVKIRRYSKPKDKLFMCLKYGGIVETKLFSDVFGKL